MKILQIISGKNVNGAVTYCKFLSEQLSQFGHQLTILTRPNGWLQKNTHHDVAFFESELNRSPFELRRVSKWIQEQQFDIMHTHMSRAHTFGVLMRMLAGIPVVATAHQCSLQFHWRLNNHVIANSKSTYDYQKRVNRVPTSKLDTVYCFTELERFRNLKPAALEWVRNELRLRGNEFVIGAVGDVIARKGHLYLFKALSAVVKEVPNLKLVLLGRFRRNEPYVKKLSLG